MVYYKVSESCEKYKTNLFVFISETQPNLGEAKVSANRVKYKMNSFIFISEVLANVSKVKKSTQNV